MKHVLALLLLLSAGTVLADGMLMTRVAMKADLAIEYLKAAIEEHGYVCLLYTSDAADDT